MCSFNVIILLVAGLVLLMDQLSKYWIHMHLSQIAESPLIPGVLHLTLTTNTGGAFSVGTGNNLMFICLVIAFLLFLLWWMVKREKQLPKPSLIECVGVGLLLGGALGNLSDRLLLGRVTDFLCLDFVTFPVFNLADVCIDIGIVLIVGASFTQSSGAKN